MFRIWWGLVFLGPSLGSALDYNNDFSDLMPGDYCRNRDIERCCPSRDDSCSVPLLGTLCYCDIFCNRTQASDCCPDFWEHCMGVKPPEPVVRPHCMHGGSSFPVGQSVRLNCNQCTCRQMAYNQFEFSCEEKPCLISPEMVQKINAADLGWKASNYSMFWGKTLDEGMKHRLGTYKPTRLTMDMTEIHFDPHSGLPESFDSRQKWVGLVQPVSDQGDCGSSWAVSTTAVASDRLAIQSGGLDKERLSPQHLLSCQNRRQRGCEGGHLDRAWWYLRKKGVASENCVPYTSGITGQVGSCAKRSNHEEVLCPSGSLFGTANQKEKLHFSTPPYRVSHKESLIQQEIFANGPVQATFKVTQDFFMYRHGVYHLAEHLPNTHNEHGYHSVRIIGWGVDKSSGIKYWLCANSWGRHWGEDGLFRIVRGQNECDIEMFVLAVWGRREEDLQPNKLNNRYRPDDNRIAQ